MEDYSHYYTHYGDNNYSQWESFDQMDGATAD